ncbi:Na+/H+ antiporter subunit E [Canibacter sp. lx-72]|uniref:Na+/H+ antiporter subunit E n=1 Tax=Canibacter zhuwentaonis TaxID=2837491 RepID=UPI001BDBC682|nr:Na+/H+ antiporter subunit E [Canibacter zhuwentaonis]MBT1018225.1 Na+/H+ antiporter subunit E [Canibacter zhuwentaonis]
MNNRKDGFTPQQKAFGRKSGYYTGLILKQVLLLLWLTFLWVMLWQELSLLSVLSGMLVSFLVMRLFFLPPVELSGRCNVIYALKYLVVFVWEMVLGSLQVAFVAFRFSKKPQTAILGVQLCTRNDFLLTLTALTVSLIPGSVVVDVDRFNSTLYLHVLNAPSKESQQRACAFVHQIENLLINAIGSKAEMERIRVSA